MSWKNSRTFAMDCAAALAGALIATPFILILLAPFIVGL